MSTPRTAYTTGYIGQKAELLPALCDELGAVVVDIRFSPRSMAKQWRQPALRESLGTRYAHVRALGNRTYRERVINIVDLDAGLAAIEVFGTPVILLCGCLDAETCHRATIAEAMRQRGWSVQEIGVWATFLDESVMAKMALATEVE